MGHRLLSGVRREREELQGVQLGGLRDKNQGWGATIKPSHHCVHWSSTDPCTVSSDSPQISQRSVL